MKAASHLAKWNGIIAGLFLTCCVNASGQNVPKAPKGFKVEDGSLSPDGRYGIIIPLLEDHPFTGNATHDKKWDRLRNSLIEVQTGQVLAVVQAGTVGWDRAGHQEILPTHWSPDGSIAVWQIDGKWSDEALAVFKLRDNKVAWQANVLKQGQQAILDRTKKAAPKKYAKVRKTNVGMGTLAPNEVGGVDDPRSAYPEGFSIQVDVVEPISFPLHITAELTSEAKPGTDMYGVLASHLTALLDENGRLTVTSFQLGPANPSHFSARSWIAYDEFRSSSHRAGLEVGHPGGQPQVGPAPGPTPDFPREGGVAGGGRNLVPALADQPGQAKGCDCKRDGLKTGDGWSLKDRDA